MARTAITKHDEIANDIRRRILAHELQPGDFIPSYRALMRQHNVAGVTVRKAIGELQSQGFITPHSGKGCVVENRATKWSHIGLGILGMADEPLLLETLGLLQKELEEHHLDVSVRFSPGAEQPQLAAFTEWAERQEGLLLSGVLTVQTVRHISRTRVPLVLISAPLDGECPVGISAVLPDENAVIDMAVGHLVGLGHRRILFINRTTSHHFDKFSARFHALGQSLQMNASFAEVRWVLYGPDEECIAELPERLSKCSEPPTVLLVDGGMRASRIVDSLNRNGWPVPERISVLALTPHVGGRHIRPDLAAVDGESSKMLIRAVEVLSSLTCEKSSVAHVEKTVPRLVTGRTCRAVAAE